MSTDCKNQCPSCGGKANAPRRCDVVGLLFFLAVLAAVAAVVCASMGCRSLDQPVRQIGGAAQSVSGTVAAVREPSVEAVKSASWALTEAASAAEKIGGAAVELSNQTAAVGLELKRTLVDAQGALAQIRETASTLTNVTHAVADRVHVSTDRAKARGEAMQELWNELKPYVAAAAIGLLLMLKRYGCSAATITGDLARVVKRKPPTGGNL